MMVTNVIESRLRPFTSSPRSTDWCKNSILGIWRLTSSKHVILGSKKAFCTIYHSLLGNRGAFRPPLNKSSISFPIHCCLVFAIPLSNS